MHLKSNKDDQQFICWAPISPCKARLYPNSYVKTKLRILHQIRSLEDWWWIP